MRDKEAGATAVESAYTGVMKKMTIKEQLEMFRKFFFEKGEKVPAADLPQRRVDLARLFGKGEGLRSAWLGHSSLLLNIDGYSVLTDPVFERKVSIVGPSRFSRDLPLKVEDLPPVDVVIVSHDHYDHLNKSSIRKLAKKAGLFVVPLRVGKRLRGWGVAPEKIVELDWWQEHRLGELTITATPARHFSGRGLFDRNRTLWASWVIRAGQHKVFFSGDSGYFPGFVEIGKTYGPFDVVFMECGAYDERWSAIHMFPEQTVRAFEDLGGTVLQPIHWATFNLAMHAWYEPVERVTSAAWQKKIAISVPMIGQVVDYERPLVTELWWLPAMRESMQAVSQAELVRAARD